MNQLVLFLSTLGPIGTRLPAPGTMGSIFGTLLYAYLTLGIGWSAELVALAFVPLFLIGIPLCSRAEILLDRSDPSEVIWDEFSVIPFVFLPLSQPLQEPISQESCLWLGIGLILFRIFDILKPSIIRTAQKLPRGLGVMIDDLLAAGVSALVLWSAKTFSLSFFA
jgi:phosphatidylglycerophosphatase A